MEIMIVACCFGFAICSVAVAGLVVGIKDDELREVKEDAKISSFERFYKANSEGRIYPIRRW